MWGGRGLSPLAECRPSGQAQAGTDAEVMRDAAATCLLSLFSFLEAALFTMDGPLPHQEQIKQENT